MVRTRIKHYEAESQLGRGIVHRDIKSDNIMLTPDGHGKLFHGAPFEAVVRDDLNETELLEALREPGVA